MLIIIIIREANTGEKREREIQDKQIVWEREEVLVLAIIWLMLFNNGSYHRNLLFTLCTSYINHAPY